MIEKPEYLSFDDFHKDIESGAIGCDDENILGLIQVFGEDIYKHYFNMLNEQVCKSLGYRLVIQKISDEAEE